MGDLGAAVRPAVQLNTDLLRRVVSSIRSRVPGSRLDARVFTGDRVLFYFQPIFSL